MRRCPGEGKGYRLQYSGLKNSMDSTWGRKESDTTEQLPLSLSFLHSWLWDSLLYVGIQPSPATTRAPTVSPNSQVCTPPVSATLPPSFNSPVATMDLLHVSPQDHTVGDVMDPSWLNNVTPCPLRSRANICPSALRPT